MLKHIWCRDLWRFIWRPSSDAACCLIIHLTQFMSDEDVHRFFGWFESVYENRMIRKSPMTHRARD